MTQQAPQAALPEAVWSAALLRGLDARARREIEAASASKRVARGQTVYADGDRGETLCVLLSGAVEIARERRGDRVREVVRRIEPGEVFGEEVTVLAQRQATARALDDSVIVEVPVHLFRRAAVRSGRAELADKLERTLRRSAARDLLATTQLARGLDRASMDALLDAVTFHSFARGQPIYREGDSSGALFIVADGMVQIQTEDDDRVRVRAYLARGDFFGDEELELASPRGASAVASGPSTVLGVPARVVRHVAASDPELFTRLRRVALGIAEHQRGVIGKAAAGATQHVFRDLYRLKIARSLLVIDLESCVRCGQCAWACETLYGTSRLVRRGDKVVSTALGGAESAFDVFRMDPSRDPAPAPAAPRSLMLPSSCQHCENPSCMVDCPTGAIGKDAAGEVFIREELCTGCGACARACPWHNIQMAPRPRGAPGPADVAVKCDLCRTFASGPACVQVCPTASIFRVDPSEDLGELAALFAAPRAAAAPGRRLRAPLAAAPIVLGAGIAAVAVGLVGAVMQARLNFAPGRGAGLAAGVTAAAAFVGLFAYAVPKRGVRLWMRRGRAARPAAERRRSRTRPHYVAHLALGIFALAVSFAHAPQPLALRATAGSALFVAFVVAAMSGLVLAGLYAVVPRVLSRIERAPLLPEDFAAEREALRGRLYRSLTGKSELVKAVYGKVVQPYVERRLGAALLVLSGRDLRAEQRALRARIDALLEGRGAERLGGVDELCRIAVELRALPAQRVLLAALRVPLPVHVASFAVAGVLLVLHVAGAIGGVR